jgi:hypothetical protein
MDDRFSTNAYDNTKCVLYDKQIKSPYHTCYRRNYDAKGVGLEALRHHNALRLVCVRIHEDVRTMTSPLPMLYFGNFTCLINFNKRFPHTLRPRVQKVAVHFGNWLELDVIDVGQEFERLGRYMTRELETEYPCVPGRAWSMEWHGLTLVSSR